MTQTIYEAVGGHKTFVSLAIAWHARCLNDPVVLHAFSHGFDPDHLSRLAAYWSEALGGPAEYSGRLGSESGVIRMHSGNGEHIEMDERAQACFAAALEDIGIEDNQLRATLNAYFLWATHRMASHPDSAADVPDGLTVGRWSWEVPIA